MTTISARNDDSRTLQLLIKQDKFVYLAVRNYKTRSKFNHMKNM